MGLMGRNEHPLYMMVPLVPLRLSTLYIDHFLGHSPSSLGKYFRPASRRKTATCYRWYWGCWGMLRPDFHILPPGKFPGNCGASSVVWHQRRKISPRRLWWNTRIPQGLAMIHGKITNIWAKSIICQPILDLPTGIYILVTTFWWKSFPENDLPKMAVAYDSIVSCLKHLLSLFSLYSPWLRTHVHSFLGFWRPTDPHAAEDTMDGKSYSTLPAAKESMDLVPTLAKNPFQHDGMISGHEEAKKPIFGKRMKKVHMVGQVHGSC